MLINVDYTYLTGSMNWLRLALRVLGVILAVLISSDSIPRIKCTNLTPP